MWTSWSLLAVWVATACATDLYRRRIPNGIVVAGLLGGLCLQGLTPSGGGLFAAQQFGGLGLASALLAGAMMLPATFVLWRLRFFGAGDAKLLTAASVWFAPTDVLPLMLVTLVAGGVQAIATLWLAYEGRVAMRMDAASPARLPYSLAIACACFAVASGVTRGFWPY